MTGSRWLLITSIVMATFEPAYADVTANTGAAYATECTVKGCSAAARVGKSQNGNSTVRWALRTWAPLQKSKISSSNLALPWCTTRSHHRGFA